MLGIVASRLKPGTISMQPDLILRGANLPDGRQGHDILITDGLIQAVGQQIDARGRDELDVSGRLVDAALRRLPLPHGRHALARACRG